MKCHFALLALFCSVWSTILHAVCASFCGQSAVPFSLEIRADGQPVLGCARPVCFGRGAPSRGQMAQFYRVWGRPDGFVRAADLAQIKSANRKGERHNDDAICESSRAVEQCRPDQWLAGIVPSPRIDRPLRVLCCSHLKVVRSSLESVRAEVRPMQLLEAGEERGTAFFEYIAGVQRLFDQNGVFYVVTVRKFHCPAPNSFALTPKVASKVVHVPLALAIPKRLSGDVENRAKAKESSTEGNEEQVLAEFSEYEEGDRGNNAIGHQKGKEVPKSDDEDMRIPIPKEVQPAEYEHEEPEEPTQNPKSWAQSSPAEAPLSAGHSQEQSQRQPQQQLPSALSQAPMLTPSQFGGYRAPDEQQTVAPQQQSQRFWPPPLQSKPIFGTWLSWTDPNEGSRDSALPAANGNYDGQQQQQQSPLLRPVPLPLGQPRDGEVGLVRPMAIPSPEDIDNVIPARGRQLIGTLARTLLGFQRLL